jgi:predicted HicB family RNase H-like nuclease
MSSAITLMRYKGFFGSINASIDDNCLFGKLEFIRPLVNYEGNTPTELKQAFEEAVDDYVSDCEARKIEPEKPFKGSFNIRIGEDRHMRVATFVNNKKFKSINDFVIQAIDHELERVSV